MDADGLLFGHGRLRADWQFEIGRDAHARFVHRQRARRVRSIVSRRALCPLPIRPLLRQHLVRVATHGQKLRVEHGVCVLDQRDVPKSVAERRFSSRLRGIQWFLL